MYFVLLDVMLNVMWWMLGGLLDRAADTAVSDFHPFGNFLAGLVDG